MAVGERKELEAGFLNVVSQPALTGEEGGTAEAQRMATEGRLAGM